MACLTEAITVRGHAVPSRVVFGPHETNLGRGRMISDRHVAYYGRRAAGGAGIVVTETASVHASDWPYERCPLAAECGPGWARVSEACRAYGTLTLAGLGHCGAQGSSAYAQQALWAPSRVADAGSRELPMEMEQPQIDALVEGFAAAAQLATAAGCDGVEVDAGPGALLRQFHSGLTNLRTDCYGADRLRLTREVLRRVRAVIGPEPVIALRLACDELAPWAGITPEQAVAHARELADLVDLLVVTRGGPYSASAYRPDGHCAAMVNLELSGSVRAAVRESGATTPVVLQGSVVDPVAADEALTAGACDLVEMTRALIADARLPAKVRAREPQRVRPCVLCNQACRVRDNRNPLVTCIGDPRSGHETVDPEAGAAAGRLRDVLVVGAGPAGLETARVLAGRGHKVVVADREPRIGGAAVLAARLPGRERFTLLLDWWQDECTRLGVRFELGRSVDASSLAAAQSVGTTVVLATGGTAAPPSYPCAPGAVIRTDSEVLADPADLPEGPVVVLDLVGGPVALGVAELLADRGREVAVVTADQVVGVLLAMSGDLADGNTRLLAAGITRHTGMVLREVRPGSVVLEDRYSGERCEVPCAVLVHCGPRLPADELYLTRPGTIRAGDCVAPRSVLQAVLEGRRAAGTVDVAAGASTASVFELGGSVEGAAVPAPAPGPAGPR